MSLVGVCVLVAQSCPSLCNPMDCSLPGFSVHGILQARILEWVAIPFCNGSFPSQGLNPSLLHCRQIIYHLSHQGSPIGIKGTLNVMGLKHSPLPPPQPWSIENCLP